MKKNEFCIPETNTIAKPIAEIIGSTDGGSGKYVYEDTGIKCPSSITTTNVADISADRWSNIASKPFQPISTGPSQPLISNNLTPSLSNTTSLFQPSFQPTPNLSLPQPNIPNGNVQESKLREQKIVSQAPHNYSGANQQEIDKHFGIAYHSQNGRLDINGFCKAGNRAVERTVEHLKYQAEQKDKVNGTGHKVLAHKHTLNFGFNLMNDDQINNLTDFLKWQNLDQ